MASFNNFKMQFQLDAQMPMIHFQSEQTGATLRGSEVKPKLDDFILLKLVDMEGKGITALKKDEKYKSIFLNPDACSEGDGANNALDYKLQIRALRNPQEVNLNDYKIYYANSAKKAWEKKTYGLFSDVEVTVICFKETLRKLLEKHIETFFLTTNFGTMQNKGFGSYMPTYWCTVKTLTEEKKKEIAGYFQERIPGCHCYAMTIKGEMPTRNESLNLRNEFSAKISERIRAFYSNMKSGQNFKGYSRSYIYQYMHSEHNLGNEKAWMKKNGIAPIVFKPENKEKGEHKEFQGKDDKYRYVRAFLGMASTLTYRNPEVKISIKNKEMERMQSPIFFKVIKNVVFIVAFEVPDEIYGAEFAFESTMGKGRISVPVKEECSADGKGFDIQKFLDSYVNYYNGPLRTKINNIGSYEKVVRINA